MISQPHFRSSPRRGFTVVVDGQRAATGPVVVITDSSPESVALGTARDEAALRSADLLVVNVPSQPDDARDVSHSTSVPTTRLDIHPSEDPIAVACRVCAERSASVLVVSRDEIRRSGLAPETFGLLIRDDL